MKSRMRLAARRSSMPWQVDEEERKEDVLSMLLLLHA